LITSCFIRDILTLVIELSTTVFLVVTILKFYDKKKRNMLANVLTNDENSDPIIFRRTDLNNSKITLYVCFVSCFIHIGIFVLYVLTNVLGDTYSNCINFIFSIFGFFFLLRHSVNFFIFLKLNKKFKRNFIRLIPERLKLRKRTKKSQTSPSNNNADNISLKVFQHSEKVLRTYNMSASCDLTAIKVINDSVKLKRRFTNANDLNDTPLSHTNVDDFRSKIVFENTTEVTHL